MKSLIPLLALTILMGASAATAQNYNITAPSGSGWDVPTSAEQGTTVTFKYTGDKYVKNVKVVPRIESISITPSCLTMLVDENVNLTCNVSIYKNSVLTDVTDNNKFVTWSSSDLSVLSVSENGKVTALREGEATITATAANGKTDALTITVKKIPSSHPENCIAGVFTVGQCKHVIFSKGNLQYNVSDNAWRFADNQWDYVGGNGSSAGTVTGSTNASAAGPWIDLFGWGMWLDEITDKAKITNTSTTNSQYAPTLTDDNEFAENHRTVDGEQWLTLSRDEWYYLRNTRANASKLFGVAMVNGVNGVIFLPDQWTDPKPDGVEFTSGVASSSGIDYYKTVNEYTATQWIEMEKSGAVFLPAAGGRYGTSVYYVGYYGLYWSSTASGTDDARYLCFYSDNVGLYYNYRYGGRSVRLVRSL